MARYKLVSARRRHERPSPSRPEAHPEPENIPPASYNLEATSPFRELTLENAGDGVSSVQDNVSNVESGTGAQSGSTETGQISPEIARVDHVTTQHPAANSDSD